ncbi:MAG: NADH-quinone oxidoreductase subunit A [Dehalococcoidales bacterium]|nr:NADH-quinone oxidoreductase subunit A [Dehalococcoidales bacterium]
MLANYADIGLFLVVAVLFTATMLGIPFTLQLLKVIPTKPNPVKRTTFECGVETIGKTWVQFNFRYYFYALVFLALDVLFVFLYPWAVSVRKLGVFSLVAVLIMILIVLVGYVYAWRKKVLEWK